MPSDLAAPRQTQRLILRPWSPDYVKPFAVLCANPEVMRYITKGRALTFADAEQISNRSLAMWDEHGYGPWGAFHRSSGRWVGRIGLNLLTDWLGADKWEVGFELAPAFWGQGLATEGAREAVRFAFEDVELDRIISVTVPDHHASRRVMEKAGLVLQGQVEWRATQVVWYALDRSVYT